MIDRAETTFTLRFTAPTDAGGVVAAYDLRRVSGDVFTPAQWDTAFTILTGQPASPGMHEMVQVEGLSPGTTYAFRVRARDDAGNWSDLSDAVSATTLEPEPPPPPMDVTPPATVADLAAAVTDTFKITLTWVAPGDDGADGQADHYDLRYRLGGLDASTWASATTVEDVPSPAPAGAPQTFAIVGLPPDTTIAFALVTVDDANNASPMSNVAITRIVSPPPPPPPPPPDTQPPGAVEDFGRGTDVPGVVALNWTAAPEPDVAFYRIYRGRSGAIALTLYRDEVEECAWEDRQVIPGREYVYAVTAVDGAGNEGPRSTLVHVRVPVNARPELPAGSLHDGRGVTEPVVGTDEHSCGDRILDYGVGRGLRRFRPDRLRPAFRHPRPRSRHDRLGRARRVRPARSARDVLRPRAGQRDERTSPCLDVAVTRSGRSSAPRAAWPGTW